MTEFKHCDDWFELSEGALSAIKSIKRATRDLRHSVQIVPENHPTQSLALAGLGKTL